MRSEMGWDGDGIGMGVYIEGSALSLLVGGGFVGEVWLEFCIGFC